MAQGFRDSGYVTMTLALRGEDGLKGSYSRFYDEVDDVLAAAKWLKAQPYIDSKRIFIAGHSNGGTLTMLAAEASNIFRAAASFSGSPDLVVFTKHDREDMISFDESDPREFEMRSPYSFATSFQCPARLYYGSLKKRMFARTTKMTAERARTKGLDVQAEQVVGDHLGAVPQEIERAIQFFEQTAH